MRVWLAFLGTAAVLVIGSRATAGIPPAPRLDSAAPQVSGSVAPQRSDRAVPQRSDRTPQRSDAAIVHRTAARIHASRDK